MVAVTSQQGQRAARSSIQGLSVDSRMFTQGGLGLQVILSTTSVFVFAQNHANIARRSLSFNEASTVKLEFWVKNRPRSVPTSSFRLEVVQPYIRLGASPPYRLLDCLLYRAPSAAELDLMSGQNRKKRQKKFFEKIRHLIPSSNPPNNEGHVSLSSAHPASAHPPFAHLLVCFLISSPRAELTNRCTFHGGSSRITYFRTSHPYICIS